MTASDFLNYLRQVEHKNSIVHYNSTSFKLSNIYKNDKFVVIELSRTFSLSVREIADKLIDFNMGSYIIVIKSPYGTYRAFIFDVKNVIMLSTGIIDYGEFNFNNHYYVYI